jgi:hypothetical protein
MKSNQLFLLLAVNLLLSSCALYTPSAVNTPLFTEKGQLTASFNGITGENYQAAYAVSNHFAVMTNRFNYKITDDSNSSDKPIENNLYLTSNAYMNEIGLGYFNSNLIKNSDLRGVFEIFGGYGFGKSSFLPKIFSKNSINGNINLSHSYETFKYFIQPSFRIKSDFIEIALSPRITNVYYSKPISTIPDSFWAENNLYDIHKNNYTYFEPTVTTRMGYKGIKLKGQVVGSFLMYNRNFKGFYSGTNLNLGIIFTMGLKNKKLPWK